MSEQEKDWNPREEFSLPESKSPAYFAYDIDDYFISSDWVERLLKAYEDLEYKLNCAVGSLYEKDEEIERLRAELSNVSQIGNGYRIGMELLSDEVTKLQKENEALRAERDEYKIRWNLEWEGNEKKAQEIDRLREENDVRNYELMEANEERDHLRARVGELENELSIAGELR